MIINKFKIAILLCSLVLACGSAHAGKVINLGCGDVVSMSATTQTPINTGAWLRLKESGGGTSGIAAAALGMIPGLSFVSQLAGTVVADTASGAIVDASRTSDKEQAQIFSVKFKLDSGETIDLPIFKDDSAIFTNGRSFAVLYNTGNKYTWTFAKGDFVTPKPGAEGYDKVCLNKVEPIPLDAIPPTK